MRRTSTRPPETLFLEEPDGENPPSVAQQTIPRLSLEEQHPKWHNEEKHDKPELHFDFGDRSYTDVYYSTYPGQIRPMSRHISPDGNLRGLSYTIGLKNGMTVFLDGDSPHGEDGMSWTVKHLPRDNAATKSKIYSAVSGLTSRAARKLMDELSRTRR